MSREKWTGRLVGKMHNEEITYEELGEELGIGKAYVGMILNGTRKPDGIRDRMEKAVDAITARKRRNAHDS